MNSSPIGDFPPYNGTPVQNTYNTTYQIPSNTCFTRLRDERGLLKDTVYIFNEDGSVNYRAMVKPEHLYFNRQKAVEIGKKYGVAPEKVPYLKISMNIEDTLEKGYVQIDTIDDSHVLMKLAGTRYLARLRGYRSCRPRLVTAQVDFAAVCTEITWIGNFETDFLEETYGDGADASQFNTFDFARNYLTAIAFNRAYARNVRNYLNIPIVSGEEVGPNARSDTPDEKPSTSTIHDTFGLVEDKYNQLGFKKFSDFVEALVKKYVKNPNSAENEKWVGNPENWTSLRDVHPDDLNTLLHVLNKKKASKK